jgi:citronellol/citronellal dehydrogenase
MAAMRARPRWGPSSHRAGSDPSVALVARTAIPGTSALPGSLAEVADRIRASGGRAEAVPADLTVPGDVETIVARATEALGPVDTLVNNAGVNFYGPALALSGRRFALMIQMMVHAPFRLCQLAVPGMVERGQGWVLNITSKQARHPKGPPYPEWARDGCVPYGMGKAALDRLTTGPAAELCGSGVSVNSLGTSGLVMTPGVAVVSPHTPDNAPVEPAGRRAGDGGARWPGRGKGGDRHRGRLDARPGNRHREGDRGRARPGGRERPARRPLSGTRRGDAADDRGGRR